LVGKNKNEANDLESRGKAASTRVGKKEMESSKFSLKSQVMERESEDR
jgi:hypothetical protein